MKLAAELTPEDALRLNVLLAGGAGDIQAVRIDESNHLLCALTSRSEAKVQLHPVGRSDRYLMRVRELLGGHALGSPGGYPVHLRRWTRMGQASEARLEALLKLGEPEAVTAVAHAPNLNDELARRAWWAFPTMEIARSMLLHPAVRHGAMAKVLSDYLVEYLPFEEDPVAAMNSIRAVMAAGTLDDNAARQLWIKAKRRPYYLIGFLESAAEKLPEQGTEIPVPEGIDGPWAECLRQNFSANGQAWLAAAELALDKPPAHEAVYVLIEIVRQRFSLLQNEPVPATLLDALPEQVAALQTLANLTEDEAVAILRTTTAVGPLMRKKLAPVLDPLLDHLRSLTQ
jgi:hypothetical protein